MRIFETDDGVDEMWKRKLQPSQNNRKSNGNILASGSPIIYFTAKLLDKRTRDGMSLFYAWYCRCEEISNEKKSKYGNDEIGVAGRFGNFYSTTYLAIHEKKPIEPVFKGVERVVNYHGWPISVVQDVLSGFGMDVVDHSYRTISELMAYCYGVAGSVGAAMAEIFGVDRNDPWMMDRACDLGIAFQLTNIAQYVMDDAKDGRVYLPAELFLSGRASPDFILDPANRSAVIAAKNVLLDLASEYYASADLAIGYLPWRVRLVVATAAGAYRVIANRIRWSDDPWPVKRPTPLWTKCLNTISFVSELVLNSFEPFSINQDRIDLWTRSAYLRDRNSGQSA